MSESSFRGPLDIVLSAIPSLPRAELARIAERMIDRLDELDGDPDLEDDDPAGQCDEDGVNTASRQPTDPHFFTELVPKYDVDQSKGPTNLHAAHREWQRQEYGVR